MISFLSRYRWWLTLACLAAAVGVIGWRQLSAPSGGRFTREQYEGVRIGMSLEEVVHALGIQPGYYNPTTEDWQKERVAEEQVAEEGVVGRKSLVVFLYADGPNRSYYADGRSRSYTWDGDSGAIDVWFVADKAASKSYCVPVHPMKAKAREWLRWLGLDSVKHSAP